jgi:hypothetical protein
LFYNLIFFIFLCEENELFFSLILFIWFYIYYCLLIYHIFICIPMIQYYEFYKCSYIISCWNIVICWWENLAWLWKEIWNFFYTLFYIFFPILQNLGILYHILIILKCLITIFHVKEIIIKIKCTKKKKKLKILYRKKKNIYFNE